MKLSLPFKKALQLFFFSVVISTSALCQSFTGMVFENPVLESGTYGADGSAYRFSNIFSGVDAVITISDRSDASVVLSNMDTTGPGLGYDKAFQPVLGIPGTAPANTTWWMDFSMSFYETGTFTPVAATEFYATGLDIDGDGASINEWAEMYKIESIDSALVNSLTFTKLSSYLQGSDYRIEGIIANSPGIDTSARNVMATYKYANKQTITFRIGASTASSSSSAAMRLNSIWFQNPYVGNPLPVKLISFTAIPEQKVAELKWTTASEANLKQFVVEKSYDNKGFYKAGVISPHGNSSARTNYTFFDDISENNSAIIYYRLRSVDIDNKSEYSEIRIIKTKQDDKINVTAYPNPVTDKLFVTTPSSWQKKKVICELFTIGGQLVKMFQSTSTDQTQVLNLDNTERGVYVVRITCGDETAQQKLIKN